MKLYHKTDYAKEILADGFLDREEDHGFRDGEDKPVLVRGVWLSNVPLDANEGAGGKQLLEIEIPEERIEEEGWELIEEGGPSYRVFVIPAEQINRYEPKLIDEAEVEETRWQ